MIPSESVALAAVIGMALSVSLVPWRRDGMRALNPTGKELAWPTGSEVEREGGGVTTLTRAAPLQDETAVHRAGSALLENIQTAFAFRDEAITVPCRRQLVWRSARIFPLLSVGRRRSRRLTESSLRLRRDEREQEGSAATGRGEPRGLMRALVAAPCIERGTMVRHRFKSPAA